MGKMRCGTLLAPFSTPASSSFPRDWLLSAACDRVARLLDVAEVPMASEVERENAQWHAASILGAAASGTMVLTSSADGTVKVRRLPWLT